MAIRYTNQKSKRNEPLSPELANKLKQVLGPMGITFVINSGGQSDTSRGRVGGHRHDHGGAGDGYFEMNGRKLTWKNPEDLKIIQSAITKLVAVGVQGIGAGDDYMGGNGHMHIGLGSPAVWGGSGSRDTAPDWLVQAHSAGLKGGATASSAEQQTPSYAAPPAPTDFSAMYRVNESPQANANIVGGEQEDIFGYTTNDGVATTMEETLQSNADSLFDSDPAGLFQSAETMKMESLISQANESTLGKSLVGSNPLTIGLSDIFKTL